MPSKTRKSLVRHVKELLAAKAEPKKCKGVDIKRLTTQQLRNYRDSLDDKTPRLF